MSLSVWLSSPTFLLGGLPMREVCFGGGEGICLGEGVCKRSGEHNPNTMGNIVLNKIWADSDSGYSSIEVDEMFFTNRTLTETEIRMFSQNTA